MKMATLYLRLSVYYVGDLQKINQVRQIETYETTELQNLRKYIYYLKNTW